MVNLSNLWFLLIAVLMTGFIFLEGFDFGVGTLVPFVAKSDEERQTAINTIGPVWDGNEVWLITAGGAMFAAFPYWYATMFSGFYLALFLVLFALIVRGVTFELRNKIADATWRKRWDIALSISSFLCAVLFPVAFSNLIGGTPLDLVNGRLDYVGGFFDLLTPFTLLAGLLGCAFMLYHGSIYIALKATGPVVDKSLALGKKLMLATCVLFLLFAGLSAMQMGFGKPLSVGFFVLSLVGFIVSMYSFVNKKYGMAFAFNFVAVLGMMGALFAGLFPYVMISSIDMENLSLSIANASSSPYTLSIMTGVALTLLPIVLAYQFWSYRIFKDRVDLKKMKY